MTIGFPPCIFDVETAFEHAADEQRAFSRVRRLPVSNISSILLTRHAEYVTFGTGLKKNWHDLTPAPRTRAAKLKSCDGSVQHQQRGLQAVIVVNEISSRLLHQLL